MLQWYANVPVDEKVKLYAAPGASVPESHVPESDVHV